MKGGRLDGLKELMVEVRVEKGLRVEVKGVKGGRD
jgi:hypothetical protein